MLNNKIKELFVTSIFRLMCVGFIVFMLVLIRKAYITWKLNTDKEKENQRYFTIVNGISLLCNCLVLMIIFIGSFPGCCEYMNGLWFMSWSISKGFLSISQIIQLQEALSQKTAASNGYPKYVFYALYSIVILSTLYTVIVSHLTFKMKVMDHFCVEQSDASFITYQAPGISIDIVIQLIIVYCFRSQLGKMKRYLSQYMPNDPVVSNIQVVLDKMLVLEYFFFAVSVSQWLIYIIQPWVDALLQWTIFTFLHMHNSLACVIIGFFMIKRNGSNYQEGTDVCVRVLFSRIRSNLNNRRRTGGNEDAEDDTRTTGDEVPLQLEVNDGIEIVESITNTQSHHPLPQTLGEGDASPISPKSGRMESLVIKQMNHKH